MLNLAPQPAHADQPVAYAEAVSRLASVRHAMRLVEPFGAGPASDLSEDDSAIAAAWPQIAEPRRRLFDRRSAELVSVAAAGVEALLLQRHEGRQPNAAASQALVDEIRRELTDIAGIVLA